MKKIILTTFAVGGLACGAFAQGSVLAVQTMFSTDGITTSGANATSPTLASTYYTGNIMLEVFVATTASVTANQIAAINALDGVSGNAALALLGTDGFALVSDINPASDSTQTAGGIAFTVSDGGLDPTTNPNQINLMAPTVTSSTEWMAIYAVGVGGAFNNDSGVLAYSQLTGANPFVSPSLPAANMTTDPTGQNLVLSPVPEPGTMALAGLGSLSLFLLRRKK
jgi:hypothetical protein